MKIRSVRRLTIIGVAIFGAHFSSAATLSLAPTDNVTIRFDTGNQGTSQLLFAGDTGNPGDFLRSTLAFDLSNPVLSGATINSVTLTLTAREGDGSSVAGTIGLDLHELSASFTNGDGTVGSGATWTSRNGTDNWTTPGGDFGGVLASLSDDPSTVTTGDEFDFSSGALASSVQTATGGSIYLLVKSDTEDATARNLYRFASSRNTNSAAGPVLTIDYTPIPEPTTALLGGLGLLFMLRRRR